MPKPYHIILLCDSGADEAISSNSNANTFTRQHQIPLLWHILVQPHWRLWALRFSPLFNSAAPTLYKNIMLPYFSGAVEAIYARAVVFGVVEWKCLRLNYWRLLRQPHYRMVGWCCGMVSACCHVKNGENRWPKKENRSSRRVGWQVWLDWVSLGSLSLSL